MIPRQNPLMALAVMLLAGVVGCQSSGGIARIQPIEQSGRILEVDFDNAYYRSRDGEYDVILVDATGEATAADRATARGPLKPVALAPLRQVMHLRLRWRAKSMTTANPASVNTAITWCVLGPDGSRESLVYEGEGLVTLKDEGSAKIVIIRELSLHPVALRGDLADPVGSAVLTGEFVAQRNPTRVAETVLELRQQIGQTRPVTSPGAEKRTPPDASSSPVE